MAKVRFNLRHNKGKDHLIQLIYRLQSDEKKVVIGTNLHVPEMYWNKKTMRVRETVKFSDFEKYNSILDKWEKSVNDSVTKFILESKVPSKSEFKTQVINTMKGINSDILDDSFINYFTKLIEIKKAGGLKTSTIQIYNTTLNHLNEYRKKRMYNADLEFKDLDRSFFIGFITYLRQTLEDNTINKIIKKVRAVINDAKRQGVSVNLDYKLPECQVRFVNQPKVYLNTEEIQKINSLELVPFTRLDKVKDLLLIGLHTGLRFSDFIRLSHNHLTELPNGKLIIKIKQIKVDEIVRVPLHPIVKSILEKHQGEPPTISEQKFNDYVKELCEKAGIKNRVSRIESGQLVFYEKYKLISSHVCRRSFATNAFKAGLPIKLIMSITGHKTAKQFMEYISIDGEETVSLASQHHFFN